MQTHIKTLSVSTNGQKTHRPSFSDDCQQNASSYFSVINTFSKRLDYSKTNKNRHVAFHRLLDFVFEFSVVNRI